MILASIIIIVLVIVALVGTIFAARDIEEDYSSNTKGNVLRLTSIYAVVLVLSGIAVWVYIIIR